MVWTRIGVTQAVRGIVVLGESEVLARNAVTVTGREDAAQTLVFVHGFGTDQHSWGTVVAAFENDFRIVLLDNVGAGATPASAFAQHRYLSLERYASDLVEVCDALQVRRAILVGHSAGGMIVLLAAALRPDIASRLVLVGASPRYLEDEGYPGGFTRQAIQDIYRAVASNYHEWAERFAPMAMSNSDRPHLAQQFADALKGIPSDKALTVLCSILQSDYRDRLPGVRHPTLLVHAREDSIVPREVADYMHRTIPECELQVIRATGHFPHLSAPAEVVAAIRGFTQQVERR